MIVNGVKITSKEHLESIISSFDEASKVALRISWIQEVNQEKFLLQYKKRALVKDKIMSEIATENVSRLMTGEWSETDLIMLTQDPSLKDILDDLSTLSFEIAYSKIDYIANPLITEAIKNGWKAKLAQYFYPIEEL